MAILTTDQSNYEDIADAIREKNGTGETYLPSEMAGAIRSIHGDVTGVKGDTESSYRTGNVNLTPANIGAKATQTPVSSPSASGTAVEFIDSITQNAQGAITPTKKTVRTATASQSGLMSAADKGNLDNLQTRMTAAEDEMDILAIYPTASGKGAMVTIEGTVDAPPAEMVIYGKSVQDGTPAPDAPADIVTAGSSGTLPMVSAGKNLIPFAYGTSQTVSGVTFTPIPDGTVNVSGTNTGSSNANFNLFRATDSGYLPNGTYTVAGLPTDGTGLSACALTVRTNDKSGGNANYVSVPASGRTIVCTDASTITSIYISISPGTAVNAVYAPMLNVGTGAEEYSAPVGITSAIDTTPNGLPGIPVASGGNYIDTGETRWICDTIDLEAGTWTKRCGVVTLDGSENWIASTQVAGRYYLASTYTPNAVPYASHLCTHAVANPGSSTSDTGKSFFASGANFDINTEYASVEAFKAALATVNMVLVYALAAPVVTQLTEAQIAALRALRGRKGLTNLYSADPAEPEFRAEMYIDIPTYIQSVIKKPLSLYDLNITPGTWNNIHPDFDPETEEYAVTLRKGNAATVNAVVIGTTATVTFGTIGGARTYFTMSTSSSAVGDRKTYSCAVNPFDAGVGGGLVMTVTKGNLSRRYYLSITSVE